jgi:hypothetical protein
VAGARFAVQRGLLDAVQRVDEVARGSLVGRVAGAGGQPEAR